MIQNSYDKYRIQVCGVRKNIPNKVRNSYGMSDYKKEYNLIRPQKKGYALTYKQYSSIINLVGKKIAEKLAIGTTIELPFRLGSLAAERYPTYVAIRKGRVKTNKLIDWDRTIRLWYSDEEARKNKTLVRLEAKEGYQLEYIKKKAKYRNKTFYRFSFNRFLKRSMKNHLEELHRNTLPKDKRLPKLYKL